MRNNFLTQNGKVHFLDSHIDICYGKRDVVMHVTLIVIYSIWGSTKLMDYLDKGKPLDLVLGIMVLATAVAFLFRVFVQMRNRSIPYDTIKQVVIKRQQYFRRIKLRVELDRSLGRTVYFDLNEYTLEDIKANLLEKGVPVTIKE
ncbi:hypothetical protein [uncultured Acetobacteroides sp.]|uniref:hypothetical protein n=1 Tax=uncultured Acetobacteroides sp. TaxID=1760811 RepID=UPI0029F5B518|nr:hypothetical protein [uncultured Acetobacteroides sp.]